MVLKLSADELQGIGNVVLYVTKQIFLVVDESTLSGIRYLNIPARTLETSHVSYLYNCQPLSCLPNSNSFAQAVDNVV